MLWLSHPPRCPHGGWHLSFTPAGLIGCRSGYFCMSLWQWQTSCAGQPPPQKDDPSTNKPSPAWRTEFTFTKPVFEWKYLSKTKTQGSWGSTQPTPAIDVARLVLMYCFTTSRQFCLSPLPKVVNSFSRLHPSFFERYHCEQQKLTGKV